MSTEFKEVFTTFENLTDPRRSRTRLHDLFEMVVVAVCATIAGSNSFTDIERFGHERLEWLRTFLHLENGIPSHDTFGRVFARLDPAGLAACIQQWFADIGRALGDGIHIDGKTVRGSFDTAAGQNPLHLVSAWASEARLTLGQIATDVKSNEITAIPLLLDLLDLKGHTVTIDAMGCQKEIAAKIVEREGDYLLALKDNHPSLCQAVEETFLEALASKTPPRDLRRHVEVETNRGREERREYYAIPAPRTLPGFDQWPGLATLVMVIRSRVVDGKEAGHVTYFLSSLPPKVRRLAKLIRGHWSIENQLHWVLDVTFTEDASRIRKDDAPQTMAMLRRLAVSILSHDTWPRETISGKRYRAALSTDVLERIILGFSRR